jgi:hypothetical protein
MEKYLLILALGLSLLWGGLFAAARGGNSLLGERAIPQALTVARQGKASYRIEFMGRTVQVGRAFLLGNLVGSQSGVFFSRGTRSVSLRLPLARLDLLIIRRNSWSRGLRGRKRGGNVE